MLRILVISNYYPPDMVGGYEKACADTVDFLRGQGHCVQVLSREWTPEVQEEGVLRQLLTIDYHRPSYTQKWHVERQNYQITALAIQRFQPDVIYVWSQRGISLAPLYAAEDAAVPRVFEMGDMWPDSYFKSGFKARLRRFVKGLIPGLQQRTLRLPHVICVSQWLAAELQRRYAVQSLQVIPNGVPLPARSATPQEPAFGLERALFVGRLDPEKGLHLALKALKDLRHSGYAVSLDIAGTGDAAYVAECQAWVARHQLQHAVRFLGWQSTDTLYPRYQLLLMPTCMREPFGLVLIEAMMHGLNVVAPNAYGPAEIVTSGETGWLFPVQNEAQQVLEIQRLWQYLMAHPQQCQQVSARARDHVRTHYALEGVKSQVLKVLQHAVASQEVSHGRHAV